ncbi:hypothetical protein [Xenorhabdus kozodoii]|uniref:WYL domain-containing protein n=1 Tax=Xenorhabdus kozodoii TaxID=351676 RepID=A0A2D0LDZ2_9GAMM|nr:hypothetical protein [Xenorhabdus kozodoii]PHM73805.1 hypothetical protein Xkoz_01633 [Xenorhabdus kozodoii]
MKVINFILTIVKFSLLIFLALFFITGIDFHSKTIPANKTFVKTLLFITASIFCYLSYRWVWIPRKKAKSSTTPLFDRTSSITDRISAEFENTKKELNIDESTKHNTTGNTETINHQEKNKNQEVKDETYCMQNGEALIWEGTTKPASLRMIGETQKILGIFTKLTIREDGEFYLDITNTDTGEITQIKEKEIFSVITVGSTRYNFVELCRKVLKLNLSEVFDYAKLIRKNATEIKLINNFEAISSTFTYLSGSGKSRRTVDIDKYLKNGYGNEYISGYCHLRNEYRTFAVGKIQTMISSEGHRKYYFHDWLTNVAGIK